MEFPRPWFIRDDSVLKQMQALDPSKDAHRIVYLMAAYEFPWDIQRALEIALMRTFGSPSISGLLRKTREFSHSGQKRYDDTALLLNGVLKFGFESPEGKETINRINWIHDHFDISNEDFLFVLTTFVTDLFDWIDAYGWRPLSEIEKKAYFVFFRTVGEKMNIKNIPDDYEGIYAYSRTYMEEGFYFHEDNKAVADSTIRILENWFPKLLRPMIFPIVRSLLPLEMLRSFGYNPGPQILRKTLTYSLKLRALFLSIFRTRREPFLYVDHPSRTYEQVVDPREITPNVLKRTESRPVRD